MSTQRTNWRPGLGAIAEDGLVRFSVWAPRPKEVRLLVKTEDGEREVFLEHDGEVWAAQEEGLAPGGRYAYLLDGEGPFPDPCSRSQPDGVHGWSAIDEPGAFDWGDDGWRPPKFEDLVIYECHIGTLTPDGTFDAAIGQLPRLKALGVTAIEVMPVAAFPGRWNWGYDGVALSAPCEVYGGPEGLRRLVDAAHGAGIAVILDVVYNHFGPDGNYTGLYSEQYLTGRHKTPWGAAINFDGPGSEHVRQFFFENLAHWVTEYHADGFRFDATHAIFDDSAEHILSELSRRIEAVTADRPRPYLIAESHENDVRYLKPRDEGGFGFDAVWADDFHHAVRTALTGESEGYLRGFDGDISTIGRTIEQGFFYEGQFDTGFEGQRGTQARTRPWPQFVYCIQNHDQVGNRAYGQRLHHTVGRDNVFAATMLLLLLPQTPLLFQGQEFLSAAPFMYFTDHEPELGRLVTEGRRNEFRGFRAFQDETIREHIPDPQDPKTFERSKLDLDRGRFGMGALAEAYHRELLTLRHSDPVLCAFREARLPIEVATHGRALVARLASPAGGRFIIVNFGEACTAPLEGRTQVLLHSDEPRFGGAGRAIEATSASIALPARCAAFLALDDE
jgi:maltooligosyltrehalose trehalohydrolase